MSTDENLRPARPFLKWAGGKRQLLPQLRRFVPSEFSNYHEPFVGSGALFFDCFHQWHGHRRKAFLTDTNWDLIGCYGAVARSVEKVIRELRILAKGHHSSPHDHYYEVRDRRFNPLRAELVAENGAGAYRPELAAMFIYLNRTGFNGLFRLNSRGQFNVPVGRYVNPQICDAANLRSVASVLSSRGVQLRQANFDVVLQQAKRGDLVYLDPPYAPLSTTALFTSYTAAGFSDDDQRHLQRVVIALAKRGCHVVLSNSTAPLVRELYASAPEAKAAGLTAHTVPAKRAINSNATRRGEILEFIVSNVSPRS